MPMSAPGSNPCQQHECNSATHAGKLPWLDWCGHLFLRKPRHHRVAVGHVPHRRSDHNGRFLHIFGNHAFVGVSRFIWCVMAIYSIGSCWSPTPGSPALLYDVLSVPPVLRLRVTLIPPTPYSLNCIRTGHSTGAASGDPKMLPPRMRPVPESTLK